MAVTTNTNPVPALSAVRLFPLGCSSARSRQGRWQLPVSRAGAMVPPRLQGALRSELGQHAALVPWDPGKGWDKGASQTPGLGSRSRCPAGPSGTAGWNGRLERQGRAQIPGGRRGVSKRGTPRRSGQAGRAGLQLSKGSKQERGRAATARLQNSFNRRKNWESS